MAIGKVIKGDSGADPAAEPKPVNRPRVGGVVNAEVFEAQQSAARIIEEAKRREVEILQNAKAMRDQLIAEAKEEGRQQGLAQVTELLVRAKLLQQQVISASEQEIVRLSLRVAEKIIGRDLERDPRTVAEIVANAVENVRNVRELTLRVNPHDARILREHKRHMMELIGRVKEIAIKEDADVSSGGCVIETEAGVIDAQLATQFEMLQRVLIADDGKKEGPA